MKKSVATSLAAAAAILLTAACAGSQDGAGGQGQAPLGQAAAPAKPGSAAPGFTLTDISGQRRSLGDFKGKYVVLEWVNLDCPFVGKHYRTGNMQKLQKDFRDKGAAWLSINSSAPGKQGNYPPAQVDSKLKELKAEPTAYLQDSDGAVGRAYGAKATPHMFLVDPAGVLVYAGAIDDKPTTDEADVRTASNYVVAAFEESSAGKTVTTPSTRAYGCSIKY